MVMLEKIDINFLALRNLPGAMYMLVLVDTKAMVIGEEKKRDRNKNEKRPQTGFPRSVAHY
jgi:hypothetical protein